MRFSLLLVIFTALSPILAAPMPGKPGRKPGTNVKEKEAHEIAPAHPGDIVLVKSQDFLGGDAGKGSSKRKIHPGIVTKHDPNTHIVHIAPIRHEHPGDVPTMSGSHVGLPETPDKTAQQSLVGLGPPKQIHQKDIKPLKPLAEGAEREPMPARLTDEHLAHLQEQLAIHNPPAPKVQEKDKKKAEEKKSKRELKLEERYFLESVFDDEW